MRFSSLTKSAIATPISRSLSSAGAIMTRSSIFPTRDSATAADTVSSLPAVSTASAFNSSSSAPDTFCRARADMPASAPFAARAPASSG